jgi:hypothetical protein
MLVAHASSENRLPLPVKRSLLFTGISAVQEAKGRFLPRHAILPCQPGMEVAQQNPGALAVVRVEFDHLTKNLLCLGWPTQPPQRQSFTVEAAHVGARVEVIYSN